MLFVWLEQEEKLVTLDKWPESDRAMEWSFTSADCFLEWKLFFFLFKYYQMDIAILARIVEKQFAFKLLPIKYLWTLSGFPYVLHMRTKLSVCHDIFNDKIYNTLRYMCKQRVDGFSW